MTHFTPSPPSRMITNFRPLGYPARIDLSFVHERARVWIRALSIANSSTVPVNSGYELNSTGPEIISRTGNKENNLSHSVSCQIPYLNIECHNIEEKSFAHRNLDSRADFQFFNLGSENGEKFHFFRSITSYT